MAQRKDGLFVDIGALDREEDFWIFAERVFGGDAYFSDLDYNALNGLLYDLKGMKEKSSGQKSPPEIRLAREIALFPKNRQNLYKMVKAVKVPG